MADSRRIPIAQIVIAAASLLLGLIMIIIMIPNLREMFSVSYIKEFGLFEKMAFISYRFAPVFYLVSLIIIGSVLFLRQKVKSIAGFAGIFFVFLGLFNFILYLYYVFNHSYSEGLYLFYLIEFGLYLAIGIVLLIKPHKIVLTALFGSLFILTIYEYIRYMPRSSGYYYYERSELFISALIIVLLMAVFAGIAAMLLISHIIKNRIKVFKYIWFIPGALYFLERLIAFLYYLTRWYKSEAKYFTQIFFVSVDGTMVFTIPLLLIGYWLLRDNEQKQQPGANVNTASGPKNAELLATWQNLLISGVITEEEYDAKRRQILGQ